MKLFHVCRFLVFRSPTEPGRFCIAQRFLGLYFIIMFIHEILVLVSYRMTWLLLLPVLQQSTGMFAHLLSVIPTALPAMPVSDLHPDVLNALSSLTLAEAQECFVRKAVHGMIKLHCSYSEVKVINILYVTAVKDFKLS